MSTHTLTMGEKKIYGNTKYLISGKIHLHSKTKTCSEKATLSVQRSQQFRGGSYWQVRGRTTSWLQRRFCFPDSYFAHRVFYFINWLLDEMLSLISNKRCISINQWTQSTAFLRHHICTGGWNQRKELVFSLYGRVSQSHRVITISSALEKGW